MSDVEFESRHRQIIRSLDQLGRDSPCPFCGGGDLDYCGEDWYAVYCRGCNACGPWAKNDREARELWKRRPEKNNGIANN